MKIKLISAITVMAAFAACNQNNSKSDASGTFEVDEVVVSSEVSGKIISLNAKEGDNIPKDSVTVIIDSVPLALQKEQVEASIKALGEKTLDVMPQIKMLLEQKAVQESQLQNQLHEKERIERLIKADAATGKQLDDINAQIDVLTKQIVVTERQVQVQRTNVNTQNRTILSESGPLEKKVKQFQDQMQRANIINPVNGTVLTKYVEAGEIVSPGKALYKIADLSVITLRAYITGIQLSEVKLGQQVKVLADSGANKYREYEGTITWISDKAEFTPKTIQTKEERANLVYAIKIKVKNDGYLKIGMYGEVILNPNAKK